jgi:tetratricopeptide (TPR) repeat protein
LKVTSILFTILFLASCALRPVALAPIQTKEKAYYDEGLKSIAQKDYKRAALALNKLLQEYPTSRWLVGVYYNLGVTYEGLVDYAQAAANYMKVIDFYDGLKTRDEAEALYRYSICQEHLGDDNKGLFALLQLQDRTQYLNKGQADVEVPARMAGSYARLGNLDEAKKYFNKSETGLKKLRRAHLVAGEQLDLEAWLPKTLYSMGHISSRSHEMGSASPEQFKNFLASVEQSQERLLRAAETGDSVWAKKASLELVGIYSDAWSSIEKAEVPQTTDQLQYAKARQDHQREMAADFDVTISHLKLLRTPISVKEPESAQVTEIFDAAFKIQQRLNILIEAPDVQDQETRDSQKRSTIKRPGKIQIQK